MQLLFPGRFFFLSLALLSCFLLSHPLQVYEWRLVYGSKTFNQSIHHSAVCHKISLGQRGSPRGAVLGPPGSEKGEREKDRGLGSREGERLEYKEGEIRSE